MPIPCSCVPKYSSYGYKTSLKVACVISFLKHTVKVHNTVNQNDNVLCSNDIIELIYQDGQKRIVGGIVDMFKILAKYLNFKDELLPSNTWAAFYPNRTIGGSLGDVL